MPRTQEFEISGYTLPPDLQSGAAPARSQAGPAGSPDSRQRMLRTILRSMPTLASRIEAAAVISGDGLMVASALGDKGDPDRFAAMCASLLALASRAAQEIERGGLKQVLVEGELGSVLLVYAGTDTVLAVAAHASANLGMVFHEARKAAEKIRLVWGDGS